MFGYFPWYVRDYLSGSARGSLSMAQKGLYLDLLSIAWERGPARDESKPCLPDDDAQLARLCHLPLEEFRGLWDDVAIFWEMESDGSLVNPRQIKEWLEIKRKIQQKREAGRKGGKAKAKASTAKAPLGSALAHPSYPDSEPDSHPDSKTSIPSGSSSPRPSQSSLEDNSQRAREEPNGFHAFWQAYPRHTARATAEKAWKKVPANLHPTVMAALETQKTWAQWQDQRYVPHAATWLNQRRWEDEEPKHSDPVEQTRRQIERMYADEPPA